MYRKDARTQLISEHTSVLISNGTFHDSQLLQTYATFCAMKKLDNDSTVAFSKLLSKFSNYPQAIRKDYRPPFTVGFIRAIDAFSAFSLEAFLTYIVPGTVCDPQRLVSVFQKDNLGNDPVFSRHNAIVNEGCPKIRRINYIGSRVSVFQIFGKNKLTYP